jgi:hypothetical protein
MNRRLLALLLITAVAAHGSLDDLLAAQKRAAPVFERAISEANEATLFLIDAGSGNREKMKDEEVIAVPGMMGSWTILKKGVVRDPSLLAALGTSLRAGIENSDGKGANCFLPRHAIRVRIGDRDVTILICFHCEQGFVVNYPPCKGFFVSGEPAAAWDRVFKAAGLTIAN